MILFLTGMNSFMHWLQTVYCQIPCMDLLSLHIVSNLYLISAAVLF